MKALQIIFLVTCAASLYSTQATSKQSVNEGSFEEKINAGYDLLKHIPNEEGTVKFLKQLHNMEKELKKRLVQSPQELPSEIMDYIGTNGSNIESLDYTIEDINHSNKVESALFQGDIILTKRQIEELMEDIKQDGSNRRKRQAFRDNTYPTTLWTNNQVYYSFSPDIFENATRAFKKAAHVWSSATCIDFIESDTANDRILLIQGTGCYSALGRTGGVQPLSLGPRCERVGTAVHEIGHALGFFHTQSRHDRDSFITLYPDNFQDGWLSQFSEINEDVNYNYELTYDYGSVMHYGALSVSKNGEPTMVPHDVKHIQTMGSTILSFYEILMMNIHYGCLDKCNASISTPLCENGGFPHPRDCFKCICPSGYSGNLCNERPSGCGKILKATSSFQVLEDTVGGKAARDQIHDFFMCNYWIEAPAGSTIEVVIEKYKIVLDYSGCPFEGVEVKTGSDVRHTGYRFCSTKNNMTLVSTRNIVPVITYASEYRKLKTVLHYRIASTGSNVSQTTPEPTFVTTSRPTSRLTTPLTSPKAETPTTRETSEPSVASTRHPTPNTSTVTPPNPCALH